MDQQNELIVQALGYWDQAVQLGKDWLLSPAAWSQLGLLIAAYVLAVLATHILAPRIWNALKDNNIEIPYPHRVVEIKGNASDVTS